MKDLHVTQEFYHDKLGLPVIALLEGRHVFFAAGESVLLCFISSQTKMEKMLPPHGAEGSIHFAFEVSREDYDGVLDQTKAKDIIVIHEHSWKAGLRSFYFYDPDGNLVEIIEEGLWPIEKPFV